MKTLITSLFVTALVLVSVPAWAGGAIDLPATGQTSCWDDGGLQIDCVGTGMNGATQLGVAWPVKIPRVNPGSESKCYTLKGHQVPFMGAYLRLGACRNDDIGSLNHSKLIQ